MARHEQQGPERNGFPRAEILVGEEPAEQRQQIDERRVRAVLPLSDVVVEQEVLRHVRHEDRPHAVVGEALPHLREEQDMNAARVAAHLPEDGDARGHGDHEAHRNDDVPHS